MSKGILGRKVGMTQVFDPETGVATPVTVIEAGPCKVLQVRTEEKDGYTAVQLGYGDKARPSDGRKRSRSSQARRSERGHVANICSLPSLVFHYTSPCFKGRFPSPLFSQTND